MRVPSGTIESLVANPMPFGLPKYGVLNALKRLGDLPHLEDEVVPDLRRRLDALCCCIFGRQFECSPAR